MLACACGAAEPRATAPARVEDYASLVAALRAAGAKVEPGGTAPQPFMPVPARLLEVDGEPVQVFELPDEESARLVAARIAPDASTVGQANVSWSDPPYFFRSGRIIVLYVGDDAATIARLTGLLGDPIAVGRADEPSVEEWVPTSRA